MHGMPALWVTPEDGRRLRAADAVVVLVGGYDGSGNYGDVLQLATAIETVLALPGPPLPLAIVERQWRPHHAELSRRYPERLGAAAFAYFDDEEDAAEEGLAELEAGALPARAHLYLYGGGYLNGWWATRKVDYAAAADALAGRALPVVASGLQLDAAGIAAGGPAQELLSRAAWIGVRDMGSLECVRSHIRDADHRAHLSGDDAIPFLRPRPSRGEPVVNFHFNDGAWLSEDPRSVRETAVGALKTLGRGAGGRLAVQPLLAYEDPRISERRILAELLEQEGSDLEAGGLALGEPLDILDDALRNDLAAFRRARFTVSCSYHVALSSLLAAIPTVLVAENDYYRQKAGGLRGLFDLDEGLVGIAGANGGPADAVGVLAEGDSERLAAHLRERSIEVVARFERGRVELMAALAQGLAHPRDERRLSTRLRRRLGRAATRAGLRGRQQAQEAGQAAAQLQLREELRRVEALAGHGLARADYALAVARDMSLPTKLLAFMSWLELHPPGDGPLISVILPTRDRPTLLRAAIRSVIAQRYPRWELVVIDDGTDPDTRTVVGEVADDRIVALEGERRGVGAARNAGLERAAGEIVCYLDDDNVMHPAWLHAVSHVFSTREDVEVAYGVSIAEHRIPGELGEHGWWPSFWQLPWSREALVRENVTDAGALAHRSGLAEARFDEELRGCEDWELLLRLTVDRDALAVPAISHAYTMSADLRMSQDPQQRESMEKVRRAWM